MDPQEEEHLRLLSIFHYVLAGLGALFACFPLIHFVVGLCLIFFANKTSQQAPPLFVGLMFTCLGGAMFAIGQACAVMIYLTGRYIKERKNYWFIFVMACIECAFFPFGTVLGVFTILVLSRPSVKMLFGVATTR